VEWGLIPIHTNNKATGWSNLEWVSLPDTAGKYRVKREYQFVWKSLIVNLISFFGSILLYTLFWGSFYRKDYGKLLQALTNCVGFFLGIAVGITLGTPFFNVKHFEIEELPPQYNQLNYNQESSESLTELSGSKGENV